MVSVKLGRSKLAVSLVFGVKTWNPWWFHWNRRFWRSQKPKFSGFNEYHHSVSSCYPQKYVNTAIVDRPSFTEYRAKKYERVSYETQHMVIFGQKTAILRHWNFRQKKKKPPKSLETILKPKWFQKKIRETTLKLFWFHKKRPFPKSPLKYKLND